MKRLTDAPVRARARARAAGAAMTIAAVAVLASCGGQNEADRIRAVLAAIAKHPMTLCEKYATGGMLLRTGGRAGCEHAAASPSAADPGQRVLDVEVHGLSAVAHVQGRGGRNVVYLTKIGSEWRVGNTG